MKKVWLIIFSAWLMIGCEKIQQEYPSEENANGAGKNKSGTTSANDISVVLTNEQPYEIKVISNGGFVLSMKATFPPEYYIGSAYFEITEPGTPLDRMVGDDSINESNYQPDTTYTANYNIYRGGEFQSAQRLTW